MSNKYRKSSPELELKRKIKELYDLETTPKNLKVYYYFYWIYTNKKYDEKYFNTDWSQRLGLKRIDFTKILDRLCCRTDNDIMFNKCKTIFMWLPGAEQLAKTMKPYIGVDSRGYTGTLSTLYNQCLTELFADTKAKRAKTKLERADQRGYTGTLMTHTINDIQFWNSSDNCNRWINEETAMPKNESNDKHKGEFYIDLESAFLQIWWNEMGGRDCEHPKAWLLHPSHKDDLVKQLGSKSHKCMLTADPGKYEGIRYDNPFKNDWALELRNIIRENAKTYCKDIIGDSSDRGLHWIFTYVERQIAEQLMIDFDGTALHHDGIWAKKEPKQKFVYFNGNKYYITINKER